MLILRKHPNSSSQSHKITPLSATVFMPELQITDEDGMKYTTVSLTDSGLAITPSYDVNGNIASFAHTRETFAEVAQTHA